MVGYSGQEIYDNFHEGQGPEGLFGGAAIVNEVANAYGKRAERIHALVARMESSWRGDAAGAARRGAGPLLVEHELAGMSLVTAQDLTNRQAGSFGDAKNAVTPMPPKPEPVNPMAMLVSPGAVVDFERQVDDYNTAAQHNVDVMNRYTGASDYNTTNLPADYGTLTDDQSGISVDSDPMTADSGDTGGPSDGGDSGPGGSGPDRRIATGLDPVAGGPVSGGVPTPNDGQLETTPGPDATVPGSSLLPPSSPGTSVVSPTDLGAGRVPGGLVPIADRAAGPSVGPGVGLGMGPGGEPVGQRRGGVAGRGGVLGGPAVVAEPFGRAATMPGVTPGTAGRGGSGMGGVPLGAGRGRGEEDIERKRPEYLEGGDPDELFDTDVLTAPPTIGVEDD